MLLNNLKFVKNLESKSGKKNDGTEWSLNSYLFEYSDTTLIALQVFNNSFILKEGQSYNVNVHFESREYQGKYYTNGSINSIDKADEEPKDFKPQMPNEKDEPFVEPKEDDDLPF